MAPLRLTRRQSREVDRIATEEFGIPGIVLMENAARSAVDAMADLLTVPIKVLVCCGPGNNGGDGLAVARHLTLRGHKVVIVLTVPPENYKGDAETNLNIATRMGLSIRPLLNSTNFIHLAEFDVLVDAVFGSGLSRPVSGNSALLIEAINNRGLPFRFPVVSLDVPSGLDADTGEPLGVCVRASRTITMGTEKTGFSSASAGVYLGQVVVIPIGAPSAVFERATTSPP